MRYLTVLDENQNSNQEILLESLIDGSIWKRTGFCNRCGVCCSDIENIFITFDGNYEPIAEPLPQVVPGKCAYFRWDEQGLGICTGRTTRFYQEGCRLQPTKIEHVQQWAGCTYSFEKISDAD